MRRRSRRSTCWQLAAGLLASASTPALAEISTAVEYTPLLYSRDAVERNAHSVIKLIPQ